MDIREIDLKIQSYVDGEMPPREMLELENELKASAEGRETMEWLTQIKRVVQENEPIPLLDTPRKLYWEAIERDIQGSLSQPTPAGESKGNVFSSWLSWLAPVSAACLVAAILITVTKSPEALQQSQSGNSIATGMKETDASLDLSTTYLSRIDEAPETSVPSSSISTFEFTSNGMTVVWIEDNE